MKSTKHLVTRPKALLVAGGTGGHINATLALGSKLEGDFDITYISGKRELDYKLYSGKNVKHFSAKPLKGSTLLLQIKSLLFNSFVFVQTFFLCLFSRPKFVIGAGGYICGPTLLASKFLGIPVFLIEQNSVMGMTNKLLSKIATKIFTQFNKVDGFSDDSKILNLGNPICSKISFHPLRSQVKNILIFGGSLGADQINNLAVSLRDKVDFKIKHQTGLSFKGDHNDGINYHSVPYIDDMSKAYEWADVIIARSGASTISELRIVQKPTIFIPYPQASDNHQEINANSFKQDVSAPVFVLDNKKSTKELVTEVENILSNIDMNYDIDLEADASSSSLNIINEIKKCLN